MRSKEAVRAKIKHVRSLTERKLDETNNVIDFMPYLTSKQRQAARDSLFLTLFMIFLSIFVILA
ncbi:hypothetical protein JZ785_26770 [Alicyclobacillus curvatus]|nr:hypothetical protein JZ785_26770 [Alicyclobacillus curvatus]